MNFSKLAKIVDKIAYSSFLSIFNIFVTNESHGKMEVLNFNANLATSFTLLFICKKDLRV